MTEDILITDAIYNSAENVIVVRFKNTNISVPLSWFSTSTNGPVPDPYNIKIIDYGQTLVLGEYEAAADAIVYEFGKDLIEN